MQMLATTEEAVGRLYEIYSVKFPEHEEFWFGLTVEQADKFSAILDLITEVKKGNASFYADRLSISKTEKLLTQLQDEVKRVQEEPMSFNEALSIALNIEKSLFNRRFFNMFRGNSDAVRRLLEYQDLSSKNHINILEIELKHYNKY